MAASSSRVVFFFPVNANRARVYSVNSSSLWMRWGAPRTTGVMDVHNQTVAVTPNVEYDIVVHRVPALGHRSAPLSEVSLVLRLDYP